MAEEERRERRLALLLVPFVLEIGGNIVGSAVAPALLVRAPMVLIAISPLIRHLVMASPSLTDAQYYGAGATSLLITDPFLYVLGRDYGEVAFAWMERRAGVAARLLRTLERWFRRAGWLLVLWSPGPFVSALAGAHRMNPLLFAALDLIHTAALTYAARRFGAAFTKPIEDVLTYIRAHVWQLTLLTMSLVVAHALWRRRHDRRDA